MDMMRKSAVRMTLTSTTIIIIIIIIILTCSVGMRSEGQRRMDMMPKSAVRMTSSVSPELGRKMVTGVRAPIELSTYEEGVYKGHRGVSGGEEKRVYHRGIESIYI
jgi:hypothetical protein